MIDYDQPFPDPSSQPVKIVRPRAGEEIAAILVSDERATVLLHWDGERSVPHHSPRVECPYCTRCLPVKGLFLYVGAWRWDYKVPVILELSSYSLGNHWPFLNGRREDLAGRRISVSRPKERPRATLRVTIGERVKGAERLVAFSVRGALEAIWNGPARSRAALYDGRPTVVPFPGEVSA